MKLSLNMGQKVSGLKISEVRRNLMYNRTSYLMLLPFFSVLFVFTVIPVISSILLSFTNFNMLQFPKFIGWENYIRLFLDDDVFVIAVRNTFVFAFLTGPFSFAVCFLFAWMASELGPRTRAFFTVVFYAPTLSTIYVVWKYIFGADEYGMVNSTLMRLGIINEPVRWLLDTRYMLAVIVLIQLWLSLGAGFLVFIAGFQGIDTNLMEAGKIDGIRNRFQELIYIIIPSMTPQLHYAIVIQIATSFAVSEICVELAGFPSVEYAAHTVVTHIMDYGSVRFEMGYASAIAVLLFAAMTMTKWTAVTLLKRVGHE